MTRMVMALVLAAATSTLTAAQSPDTPQKGTNLTTLSGCVDSSNRGRSFTLSDTLGETYSLKGINMREFVGKRVEITGTPRKLVIAGGLYPSPNVAAGAHGMDHTQAAMAAQAGPNSNMPRPPEFTVKSVRALQGSCVAK